VDLENKAKAGENRVEEFEKGVIQELKEKHRVK